jgi:beta-fructofuranosidase
MAFELEDRWTWDFWLVDDSELFHLFFLQASRSLGDPELRHVNAEVGHAVSEDLRSWRLVGRALGRGEPPAYDDRAVWTGCVVRDGSRWRMFRTGLSLADAGTVQRIGWDASDDLMGWRHGDGPGWPLEADPRWYEKSSTDEHWRDPWVLTDGDGLHHMYITARHRGSGPGRGAVGHAVSRDLSTWEVRPPLSQPDRFEQLEVMSLLQVEGRWLLAFSCLAPEMVSGDRRGGGVWTVRSDGPGSPIDLSEAVLLADDCVYAGRVVHDRSGRAQFLAFVHHGPDREFRGGLIDPVPVSWRADGRGLELPRAPVDWCSAGAVPRPDRRQPTAEGLA